MSEECAIVASKALGIKLDRTAVAKVGERFKLVDKKGVGFKLVDKKEVDGMVSVLLVVAAKVPPQQPLTDAPSKKIYSTIRTRVRMTHLSLRLGSSFRPG